MTTPVVVGTLLDPAIDALPVLDARGGVAALSACHARSDALVLCVRQLGCVACTEQVARLRERLAELVSLSIEPWILACAPFPDLARWIAEQELGESLVSVRTDPTLAVHRALGLHHGVWRSWGARAAIGFAGAVSRGYLPGAFRGAVSQQAGGLLVGRDATVRALVRSEHLGDHVSLEVMIDAAMRARVAESALRL